MIPRIISGLVLAHLLFSGTAAGAQPADKTSESGFSARVDPSGGEFLIAHGRRRGGWHNYGERRHERRRDRDSSSTPTTTASTGESESSYSGSGADFSNVDWGRVTYNGLKQAAGCGNPLCFTFQSAVSLAIGPVFDVPYYALKPPLYILKGLGKGARWLGRTAARPFKN